MAGRSGSGSSGPLDPRFCSRSRALGLRRQQLEARASLETFVSRAIIPELFAIIAHHSPHLHRRYRRLRIVLNLVFESAEGLGRPQLGIPKREESRARFAATVPAPPPQSPR